MRIGRAAGTSLASPQLNYRGFLPAPPKVSWEQPYLVLGAGEELAALNGATSVSDNPRTVDIFVSGYLVAAGDLGRQ